MEQWLKIDTIWHMIKEYSSLEWDIYELVVFIVF